MYINATGPPFYTGLNQTGGKLCSSYGGAAVLTGAVLAWSLCTLLTPIAAAHSMPALILCRILMGAGEGMSQPAIHAVVAAWVPKTERTQAIAVASSGMISGTVLSMLSAGIVARAWETVFYAYGVVGLVWCLFAWMHLKSSPALDLGLTTDELRICEDGDKSNESGGSKTDPPTLLELIKHPAFIGITCCHFAHNWGWYMELSWLPTYFSSLG